MLITKLFWYTKENKTKYNFSKYSTEKKFFLKKPIHVWNDTHTHKNEYGIGKMTVIFKGLKINNERSLG